MSVQFFFLNNNITLYNRTALKLFVMKIFKKENKRLHSLNYIFCSDDYLLEINKTHLQHNYYTDIITFDLSDTPGEIIGEVYISADRVRANAVNLHVSIKEELHRVIFHGALHLCGYKDKTPEHFKKMRAAENLYLALYFK
ncbi:MAG: rRNA maturation RNase YbeY [Bacteroidota bacterium]